MFLGCFLISSKYYKSKGCFCGNFIHALYMSEVPDLLEDGWLCDLELLGGGDTMKII